jgi:hypothetical protein
VRVLLAVQVARLLAAKCRTLVVLPLPRSMIELFCKVRAPTPALPVVLTVMLLVFASRAVAEPALSSDSVPAVIVVAPVYVLAPLTVRVADELLRVRVLPLPAIIPPKLLLEALV